MPTHPCCRPRPPPALESGVNPSHARRPDEAWQGGRWTHDVAWASGFPLPGFQLGYRVGEVFEPIVGPVFDSLAEARAHALRTGWIK
jgi:hypothetical protein